MSDINDVADRLALRELIDSYCNVVNRRAWAEMPALYTEDAKWAVLGVEEVGEVNRWEGRDNVVAAVTNMVEQCTMLLHMTGACQVRVSGDTATATLALQEIAKFPDGNGIYLIGIYYDKMRRTAEGWKFSSREFHARYLNRHQPMLGEHFPLYDPA